MKWLYKYPQREYPVSGARRRRTAGARRAEFEYELLDTGVFEDERYFDVFVEYAKASPEDMLIRITPCNRGPEPATLDVLPTLWFRNTWTWGSQRSAPRASRASTAGTHRVVAASHLELGPRWLYVRATSRCCSRRTRRTKSALFGKPNRTPYVKDGVHNHVVHGRNGVVNPEAERAPKRRAHHRLSVGPGESPVPPSPADRRRRRSASPMPTSFGSRLRRVEVRLREADELYAALTPPSRPEDEARVAAPGAGRACCGASSSTTSTSTSGWRSTASDSLKRSGTGTAQRRVGTHGATPT